MIDFHAVCRQIYEATRENTIVVFAIRGDVHFFKLDDKRYAAMMKDFPKSLVGIYDSRCTFKYIQEDIL